jgi:hypothetical protein
VSQLAHKACKAFVESVREASGGDFDKILIRPTVPGQVAVQFWPRGERDAQGEYVEISERQRVGSEQRSGA